MGLFGKKNTEETGNDGFSFEKKEEKVYKENPLRYIKFNPDGSDLDFVIIYEYEGKARFFATYFEDGDDEDFADMIEFTDEKEGTVVTYVEDDDVCVEKVVIPRDLWLKNE